MDIFPFSPRIVSRLSCVLILLLFICYSSIGLYSPSGRHCPSGTSSPTLCSPLSSSPRRHELSEPLNHCRQPSRSCYPPLSIPFTFAGNTFHFVSQSSNPSNELIITRRTSVHWSTAASQGSAAPPPCPFSPSERCSGVSAGASLSNKNTCTETSHAVLGTGAQFQHNS